jgi:hypothetical protein
MELSVALFRSFTVLAGAALLAGCAANAQPSHLGVPPKHGEKPATDARARGDGIVTTVTIDSRYGHGSVSGPVRKGARNLEVRLPGGSWIDCARDCAETLRRQSVDFWENHGREGRDGPDYFTWRR